MFAKRWNPNLRIISICLFILALDQVTKGLIQHFLPLGAEHIILEGFFRFVHWGNTGAAWSMLKDHNTLLTFLAMIAVVVLFLNRHHFEIHLPLGQIAMGLMLGGILGNLADRLRIKHVIDFLYFYVRQRSGEEIGFPAFNIADSAICSGVGLLLLISWNRDNVKSKVS